MNRQRGMAAVEFALVGAVAFTVLLGSIEVARYYFVMNAAAEATRRAARVAAVTSGTAAAKTAATAIASYVPGFTATNVSVTYRDAAGATVAAADPAGFVTVAVSGYSHALLIPGMTVSVAVPAFSTTVPAESLGVEPTS